MARLAGSGWDLRPIPPEPRDADAGPVEESSVSESLPELYRQVLDRVDALERAGFRREAGLIRSDATRVYSAAWNEAASRRLSSLRIHADRVVAGQARPRTPSPLAAYLSRWTLERSL